MKRTRSLPIPFFLIHGIRPNFVIILSLTLAPHIFLLTRKQINSNTNNSNKCSINSMWRIWIQFLLMRKSWRIEIVRNTSTLLQSIRYSYMDKLFKWWFFVVSNVARLEIEWVSVILCVCVRARLRSRFIYFLCFYVEYYSLSLNLSLSLFRSLERVISLCVTSIDDMEHHAHAFENARRIFWAQEHDKMEKKHIINK